MNALRVHDAADDLIDDLVHATRNTVDRIDEQITRLQAARTAAASFLEAIRPDVIGPTPSAIDFVNELATIKPKLAAVPNGTYDCAHCAETFGTKQGLAVHTGRKHPMTKTAVDHQAARDAAAAAL